MLVMLVMVAVVAFRQSLNSVGENSKIHFRPQTAQIWQRKSGPVPFAKTIRATERSQRIKQKTYCLISKRDKSATATVGCLGSGLS